MQSSFLKPLPKVENDSLALPQPPPQKPEVDYRVQFLDVENPLGLKELSYKKIYQVWKLLVLNGEIVEVVGLMSSALVDTRYLYN
ncbi:MAG: hypothetical protein KGS72_18440 [Cyanobacteria bacterium REEB67]|nr:hypothetical protein [Cyanobacteria bacterium REEB67]